MVIANTPDNRIDNIPIEYITKQQITLITTNEMNELINQTEKAELRKSPDEIKARKAAEQRSKFLSGQYSNKEEKETKNNGE